MIHHWESAGCKAIFDELKDHEMYMPRPAATVDGEDIVAEENDTANKAYAALKGKTKIFFLGMPQSKKLQPDFLDEEATAEFNNVMKTYNENYGIGYWYYPDVMPDSCFSDGFHLNQVGAKKYQEWFVSQLTSKE